MVLDLAKEKKTLTVEKIDKETIELPDIVTLYFQRADNLKKTVTIKTTTSDLMERVVALAAEKLGIKSGRIGLTGGGMPISFIGKTVGDILREYNTVSFHISSADMLG